MIDQDPAHPARQFVSNHGPKWHETIITEAKRWVAAECCAFLEYSDPGTERWRPYQDWAASLSAEDAVLTFNYDRVIETLILQGHDHLEIVDPAQATRKVITPGKTPVFKLHGSVDWRFNTQTSDYEISHDPRESMRASWRETGIATPGPSKYVATMRLEFLWDAALESLEPGVHVILIGYRFPESDTAAAARLLGKLQSAKPIPAPHVVLGPNVNDGCAARVDGLFRNAGIVGTTAMPLYSQDYLATYAMKKLAD